MIQKRLSIMIFIAYNFRMNLIILSKAEKEGDFFHLTDKRAIHIKEILRSKEGDIIEIGLIDGPQGKAEIVKIADREVVIKPFELKEIPHPQPTIDLICALPRPQTLKKVLITSATMGVRHLYLIRANRVEKSFFHSPLLLPENYNPFLIEGLCQGKNTRLPQVSVHDRFKQFFEEDFRDIINKMPENAALLLPDFDTIQNLSDVYSAITNSMIIAIGPEGGWVPFELDLMKAVGFQGITLGRWVLRVETAVAGILNQIELLKLINNK
ncbi:MAG: RsmE family RNA methyltransferase [bacterium]